VYQVSRLPGGLTVATAEMPHMNSVSLGIWVGIGSRYEPAELNGVCHFIEHLLFKGTRKRSARQISEAVEGVGGYLNAFTSEETTCFHCKAGHDRFDQLLDVLMDMLLHSRFDPVEIRKEREVIKEEIAMYLDQPQHHVQELLNAALWPGQPLGRPITGTGSSLNRISRPQLLDYLRCHYLAGNALLVAAGRVTHARLRKAARRFAAQFNQGSLPQFVPAAHQQARPAIRLFSRKTEQTQLALGIRTCSRHDERRFALRLLNSILGENMSSRLFQIIREEHGLAYSIYSSPSFFADTGDLVISAGLDTAHLEKTLKLILRELRRLTQSGPGPAELRRARDFLLGQIDLSLEHTDNQMNWIGEQLLGYGDILTPASIKKRLSQISAIQVRDVARDFFRRERFTLALVSPLKSDRHLARSLGW
jgi:predicted Zn-dependent peptidase